MKPKLVDETDLADLSSIFTGRFGRILARMVMSLLALNKLNNVYATISHLKGGAYTSAWMRSTGVKYDLENGEILEKLPEGAFVTVSNHPFGLIDGFIIIDIITRKRTDFLFMVNSVLNLILRPIAENIIGVKPTTSKSGSSIENMSSLKACLKHLNKGGAMGFFPAGAVSNYNEYRFKTTDREWQPTVVKMIQMAKVPVIPMYIEGRNSLFFHFLGRINWQLRSLRLPYEILNKHKIKIRVIMGDIITVEEQQKFANTEDLAAFLRARTYALGEQKNK